MLGNEEFCCWEVEKERESSLKRLPRIPEKLCWLIDECENWWIRKFFFFHKQFSTALSWFFRDIIIVVFVVAVASLINRNVRQKSVNFNLKLLKIFLSISSQLTCSDCHHFSFLYIFFLIYNVDVFYCYFMMIVNVRSPTLCFLLVQYIDFEWNWIYIELMAHIVCMCVTYKKQNTFRLKRHD